jgi:hypothetical protein
MTTGSSKWQGGPGLPAVTRAFIGPFSAFLVFEDCKDFLLRSRGFRWVQEVPFNC